MAAARVLPRRWREKLFSPNRRSTDQRCGSEGSRTGKTQARQIPPVVRGRRFKNVDVRRAPAWRRTAVRPGSFGRIHGGIKTEWRQCRSPREQPTGAPRPPRIPPPTSPAEPEPAWIVSPRASLRVSLPRVSTRPFSCAGDLAFALARCETAFLRFARRGTLFLLLGFGHGPAPLNRLALRGRKAILRH